MAREDTRSNDDNRGGGKRGDRIKGLKERIEERVQDILEALNDWLSPEWTPAPIPVQNVPGRRRRY